LEYASILEVVLAVQKLLALVQQLQAIWKSPFSVVDSSPLIETLDSISYSEP